MTSAVPYFDLSAQYLELREEILAALDGVCRDSHFVLGPEVELFEQEFAAYCGAEHCVALNSGTSALHLALLAAGVREGDDVMTSPNTFIATAEAISYSGARPVFADVSPESGNLDPKAVERAITDRTRAIVPVHLYGRPADLDPILALARDAGIAVIEDAAQAHGARLRGRRVGAFGLAAAFSFYPAKNLGAYGEGGALTTDDPDVAEFARVMRDHGQKQRYGHATVGFNYRMDGFQGAVLRIKLRRLDDFTARRIQLADIYRELLGEANLQLPQDRDEDVSVYHLFPVWVDDRDAVRAALAARGIGTGIHYPVPVHLQPAYRSLGLEPGAFPHAERACSRALSLPLYPEMPLEHVHAVASALTEIVGRAPATTEGPSTAARDAAPRRS